MVSQSLNKAWVTRSFGISNDFLKLYVLLILTFMTIVTSQKNT